MLGEKVKQANISWLPAQCKYIETGIINDNKEAAFGLLKKA